MFLGASVLAGYDSGIGVLPGRVSVDDAELPFDLARNSFGRPLPAAHFLAKLGPRPAVLLGQIKQFVLFGFRLTARDFFVMRPTKNFSPARSFYFASNPSGIGESLESKAFRINSLGCPLAVSVLAIVPPVADPPHVAALDGRKRGRYRLPLLERKTGRQYKGHPGNFSSGGQGQIQSGFSQRILQSRLLSGKKKPLLRA